MRKSELENNNPEIIREILQKAPVGYLGILLADGFPRVVPVNFASKNTTIYFHGALEGEKYEVLKTGPKVTFNASLHYAYIPSHWRARDYAGKATMFFKSVQIKGSGVVVDDPEEKAEALQLLMEKYQPEGSYRPITTGDKLYAKDIIETGVFRIESSEVTCKIKMGQDYPDKVRRQLIGKLIERGKPIDLETVEEMEKFTRKE